ncbi:hypothetical protein L2E82_10570 [Cichorium intybus]|uniref:Uncharacterized protein n=1 Tax=Cichorium intybus TaxID=13427 RepID=A0ACB9GBY2_CICIN|nr:hypothetical protein L2E82_10570 [Cichorium intybus]
MKNKKTLTKENKGIRDQVEIKRSQVSRDISFTVATFNTIKAWYLLEATLSSWENKDIMDERSIKRAHKHFFFLLFALKVL